MSLYSDDTVVMVTLLPGCCSLSFDVTPTRAHTIDQPRTLHRRAASSSGQRATPCGDGANHSTNFLPTIVNIQLKRIPMFFLSVTLEFQLAIGLFNQIDLR